MNQPSRPHPILQRPKRQKWISNLQCNKSLESEIQHPLSPDVSLDSPALCSSKDVATRTRSVKKVGNYLILERISTNLISPELYKAVNVITQKKYLCKASDSFDFFHRLI